MSDKKQGCHKVWVGFSCVPGKQDGNLYCWRHDPEYEKKRIAAKMDKYKNNNERKKNRELARAYRLVIADIAGGDNPETIPVLWWMKTRADAIERELEADDDK